MNTLLVIKDKIIYGAFNEEEAAIRYSRNIKNVQIILLSESILVKIQKLHCI